MHFLLSLMEVKQFVKQPVGLRQVFMDLVLGRVGDDLSDVGNNVGVVPERYIHLFGCFIGIHINGYGSHR